MQKKIAMRITAAVATKTGSSGAEICGRITVSFKLFQLRANELRAKGQVVPFALHVGLTLPAKNVAKELPDLRIDLDGIAGRTIRREIDVRRSRQRIAAAADVGPGQLDKRTFRLVG